MRLMMRLCCAVCLLGMLQVQAKDYPVTGQGYRVEQLSDQLEHPWSVAFLPNGDLLITEKPGRLRRFSNGELSAPIAGVPDVYYAGQGGLLEVMPDQNFSDNQRLYLTFAHGGPSDNATRLVSARLNDDTLSDVTVLFTASPTKKRAYHYGGRLIQDNEGLLYLSVGDGGSHRDHAQQLDSHLGKIVRLKSNGEIPAGNPFINEEGALPEIWSWGHRNPQGLVITESGTVYANEHGPKGGDEINLVQAGNNYGWPVLTRGVEYSGETISTLTSAPGMELPMVDWTPSIAPGGMAWYSGDEFPEFEGDLIAVSLKQQKVRRIDLDGGKVVSDSVIFDEIEERMRDVRVGPDGAIYILTDDKQGKLLKITAD